MTVNAPHPGPRSDEVVARFLSELPDDLWDRFDWHVRSMGPGATVDDVLADLAAKCLPTPGRLPTGGR